MGKWGKEPPNQRKRNATVRELTVFKKAGGVARGERRKGTNPVGRQREKRGERRRKVNGSGSAAAGGKRRWSVSWGFSEEESRGVGGGGSCNNREGGHTHQVARYILKRDTARPKKSEHSEDPAGLARIWEEKKKNTTVLHRPQAMGDRW